MSCKSTKKSEQDIENAKKGSENLKNMNTQGLYIFKEIDVLPFDKLMLPSKLLFMHAIHNDYVPASFKHVFVKKQHS